MCSFIFSKYNYTAGIFINAVYRIYFTIFFSKYFFKRNFISFSIRYA